MILNYILFFRIWFSTFGDQNFNDFLNLFLFPFLIIDRFRRPTIFSFIDLNYHLTITGII